LFFEKLKNKGTILEVSVPLRVSDKIKEKPDIIKRDCRVFIIDDNENIIRFLTRELEELGCKVKSGIKQLSNRNLPEKPIIGLMEFKS
jgi:hypothetical protein